MLQLLIQKALTSLVTSPFLSTAVKDRLRKALFVPSKRLGVSPRVSQRIVSLLKFIALAFPSVPQSHPQSLRTLPARTMVMELLTVVGRPFVKVRSGTFVSVLVNNVAVNVRWGSSPTVALPASS